MIISIVLDFMAVLICGSFTIAHICERRKELAIITFWLMLINLLLLIASMITLMQS